MNCTKGKWKVEGDCYIIAGEEHKHSLIADLATANDDYEANAKLIAASPLLYEAVRETLFGYAKGSIALSLNVHTQLLNALSKAE